MQLHIYQYRLKFLKKMGDYMKSKILVITLIVLSIIGYFIYSIPREIHIEKEGIMYRLGNKEYEEEVQLIIEGKITKNIFSSDRFQGDFTINGITYPRIDIKLEDINDRSIYYVNEYGDYESLGMFFSKDDFSILTIAPHESKNREEKSLKSWATKDGILISFPAKTRLEAQNISIKLLPPHISEKITNR